VKKIQIGGKYFLKYLLQWEKKWGKIGLRIFVRTCLLKHIFNKTLERKEVNCSKSR